MTIWLLIAAGLVVLTLGAELIVRGAAALARKFGMSELLIGLTLVGFGTSTPELVSSLQAAFAGSPGIAVGNVVGSNIANILLILGVVALIAPAPVDQRAFRRDSIALAGASLAMAIVVMTGDAGRIAGAVFLAGLVSYIVLAFLTERQPAVAIAETARHEREAAALPDAGENVVKAAVFCLVGLALLIVGARWLVGGAVGLAQSLQISDAVIGLTVVAVGTSLPELVTSVMAALRGKSDLALGNVIGSNLYNILGILGATALVHPVAVPASIAGFDIWVMLGATAAMIVFAITGRTIARWEGATLFAAYVGYIGWLAVGAV